MKESVTQKSGLAAAPKINRSLGYQVSSQHEMPSSSASDSGVFKGGPASSEVTALAEVRMFAFCPAGKMDEKVKLRSPLGSMTQRMLPSYLFMFCSLAQSWGLIH